VLSRRRERKARIAAGLASVASAEERDVGMGMGAGAGVEGGAAAAGTTVVGRSGGEAAAMARWRSAISVWI
jgi:hypothetical protein